MAEYLPYTEKVGVANAFGWLHLPDGRRVLAESVVFVRGTGIVVDLESGLRRHQPADGSCHWQPLEPEQACGIVGIPAPELQEGTRRVDPYHVDRWRSPLFCALVEVIHERMLPCAYSLLAHLDGHWTAREFLFATDENPEQFAVSVGARVSAGDDPVEAVRVELAADASFDDDPQALQLLLDTTGWRQALEDLPARLDDHAARIAARRGAPVPAPADGQLALI